MPVHVKVYHSLDNVMVFTTETQGAVAEKNTKTVIKNEKQLERSDGQNNEREH